MTLSLSEGIIQHCLYVFTDYQLHLVLSLHLNRGKGDTYFTSNYFIYCVPSRSPSPFAERTNEEGFHRKRPNSPEGGGALDRGLSPRPKESKEVSTLLDFFEPFSPDHSPEHSFDLYDDEMPPAKRVSGRGIRLSLVHISFLFIFSQAAQTDAGYEEFSDEEIAFAEDEFEIQEAVVSYRESLDLICLKYSSFL